MPAREASATSALRVATCTGVSPSGRSAPSRDAATSTSPGFRSVTLLIQVPSATSSTRCGASSAPIAISAPKRSLMPSPTSSRPERAISVRSRCTTFGSSATRSAPRSSAIASAIGPRGPRRSTPYPPSERTPLVESVLKRCSPSLTLLRCSAPAAARSPRFSASICVLSATSASPVDEGADAAVGAARPAALFPSLTELKLKPSCSSSPPAVRGAAVTGATRSFVPRSAAPAVAVAIACAAASRSSPSSGGSRPISARNSSSRSSARASSRS